MLFTEKMEQVQEEVDAAVNELFIAAEKNQTHPQDLLIILEHGFYAEEFVEFADQHGLSYYHMGPNWEGYSEQTQYELYDAYRHELENDKEAYLSKVKTDENLKIEERMRLHVELMIYLKFWESDMIVKKLYQLVRLSNSEAYNWHFKIKDFKKGRQQILRQEVRDKSQKVCPKFSLLINRIYSNQIRNSIAHSQYAFIGRTIHLNNKKESPYHLLGAIDFEDWEDYIHRVIMMYNAIIGNINQQRRRYQNKASGKHFGLDIRVPKKDGTLKTEFYKYLPDIGRWNWYKNVQS